MNQNQKLEDSGKRRTFSTGAVRDRGDLKPRPDLISPHAQMREGMIMTLGAQKYDVRNWERGLPISECLASAQRHIEQYKRGDTNEDHIAQARWNLGVIIHFEEEIKAGRLGPSLDDMPKYAYLPPCPRCNGEMKHCFHPETGPESYCPTCRLTSLDSWPEKIPDYPHPVFPTITPIEEPPAFHVAGPPTFYIAGPMRGYKDLNFPAFNVAREYGKTLGYNIISPADLDREQGIDPLKDPTFTEQKLSVEEVHRIIRRDTEAIMSLCPERGDGIAVLFGWEDSTGASAEVYLARWLGLKIVDANDFYTSVEIE